MLCLSVVMTLCVFGFCKSVTIIIFFQNHSSIVIRNYKGVRILLRICDYTAKFSEPHDVTVCEGREAVFTCVLNSNIRSDDVQWYRFIKDTSSTVMVNPNGENINVITKATGCENTTSSSLTIPSVKNPILDTSGLEHRLIMSAIQLSLY